MFVIFIISNFLTVIYCQSFNCCWRREYSVRSYDHCLDGHFYAMLSHLSEWV